MNKLIKNKLINIMDKYGCLGPIIAFLLAITIVVISNAAISFNDTQYTVTVTDKERVAEDGGKYLIFAEDENNTVHVFENTDNLLRGKFNSSTVQGMVKVGETYKLTVIGYRIPFCSMYQNIIDVEEVKK